MKKCCDCGTEFDEDTDEYMTAYENGPLGLFEGKEIAVLCMPCYEAIYEPDDDDCDEDFDDTDMD